jgi:hypothetical protein
MTNIPIERKSRPAWWIWLAAAVVIGLLAWWLVARLVDDGDNEAADGGNIPPTASAPMTAATPQETTSDASAATSPEPTQGALGAAQTTDVSALIDPDDPDEWIGQTVEVGTGSVLKVIGEYEMFVGTEEQFLFVVLDKSSEPRPLLGRVMAGDEVSMSGLVRELPPLEDARRIFGLRDEDAPSLEGEQLYLAADSVTVEQR